MTDSETNDDFAESPFVFLCGSCRMPLADSGECIGKPEGENIVLLKAVTENVEIDENKAVSSFELDAFSTVQVLFCKGCASTVGAYYIATPGHLDHRRDLFTLHTSAVSCYCFSNPHKQKARINLNSVNLPNIPYMEAQLKKCRTVFGFCERAVTKMENNGLNPHNLQSDTP